MCMLCRCRGGLVPRATSKKAWLAMLAIACLSLMQFWVVHGTGLARGFWGSFWFALWFANKTGLKPYNNTA
jgi:hypothetical protein